MLGTQLAHSPCDEATNPFPFWALLLTVKQDTVKTSNQISDTRWGALSGLRLEQPVICEPTFFVPVPGT